MCCVSSSYAPLTPLVRQDTVSAVSEYLFINVFPGCYTNTKCHVKTKTKIESYNDQSVDRTLISNCLVKKINYFSIFFQADIRCLLLGK